MCSSDLIETRVRAAYAYPMTAVASLCAKLEMELAQLDGEDAATFMADLGEAVRPYLRVFYEAIRHYPGIDLSGHKAPTVDESFLLAA